MHPNGIAAVYGERPTAGSAAFAKNRSEALGAPDPLQTVQQIHWQIHKAHCDYQRVAEDRRRLGPKSAKSSAPFSTAHGDWLV
jgi:hypothetical protein